MRKIIGKVSILFSMLMMCIGCQNNEILSHEAVDTILNAYGVYSYKIADLVNYREYILDYDLIDIDNIVVNTDEIGAYIEGQLESYTELIEVVDRDVVQKNDVVIVSYMVSLDGKVINEVSQETLIVGKGSYDQQFENVLLGKKVGTPFTEKLISPEGEKMMFNIIVESINYFKTYDLTDEFVKEKMGMNSIEEYYEECKNLLISEKIDVEKESLKTTLFQELIDKSSFLLGEKEVVQFALRYVESEEQLAYVHGLNLEEYIQTVLNENKDDFFHRCYEQGKYEIEKIILVGAIFSDLQYIITDEDMLEMCDNLGYEYSVVAEDEYACALVEFAIMEQRVLSFLEK